MGGRLRLVGSGPDGSTFAVELPACLSEGAAENQSVTERRKQGARPGQTPQANGTRTPWPSRLGEQAGIVRAALQASSVPLTAKDVARSFRGARAGRVRSLLDTLSLLGHARDLGDGRYVGL
jgi:hypothetical protein